MAPATPQTAGGTHQIDVAVVTSSRSDWCHLNWPLRDMQGHPAVAPRLIVTGAHLSPEFGETVDAIEADGFEVAERVECDLSADTDVAMAETIGQTTSTFATLLAGSRPDILLLSADRHEMLAPAMAAMALRIPIAHIEGGEWTAGAIDNAVRHALTMFAHLHFTTTVKAARRLVVMGEESWRVHRVGAPSLDHLRRSTLLARDEIEKRLALDLSRPPVLVGYHPVTLQDDPTAGADGLFAALTDLVACDERIVFCLPNADAGGRALARRVSTFCDEHSTARSYVNLDPVTYWSLLREADVMLGNSSSGLMEAPSLGIPAINIGPRQTGRERAVNVIDVDPEAEAIRAAIELARTDAFREGMHGIVNPYGDGRAGTRIAQRLAEAPPRARLLHKRDTLSTTDPPDVD